ncbi:MAG: hypothetical protein GY903_05515 [Fuerstiella sp.]|nr:hypothetical protein [Fuerstiella sp.]MCP4853932.1 hypothetical protein [Fuerstiella sp.]
MKTLLRMSLFIIARAGLCLVVAAWIVGQWRMMQIMIPTADSTTVTGFGRSATFLGLEMEVGVVELSVSFYEHSHRVSAENSWLSDDAVKVMYARFDVEKYGRTFLFSSVAARDILRRKAEEVIHTPGCVVWGWDGGAPGARVSHWLITTLFTAFNIVLHFIYRKRPEDKSCEV